MEMLVCDVPGRILEVEHTRTERFGPGVAVGNFCKSLHSEDRRNMIEYRAKDHRGGKVAAISEGEVELLKQSEQLREVEIR